MEGDGTSTPTSRADIFVQLAEAVSNTNAVAGLVSLVDTATKATTLVATDHNVQCAPKVLNPAEVGDAVLMLPFIPLRKMHVIPALVRQRFCRELVYVTATVSPLKNGRSR